MPSGREAFRGTSDAVPPAAAIFSAALPLNLWAETVSALLTSPRASTLIGARRSETSPDARRVSGSTTAPASKRSAMLSRLTTAYSIRKMLLKPRFGTRRWSGIWPPSNPRFCL